MGQPKDGGSPMKAYLEVHFCSVPISTWWIMITGCENKVAVCNTNLLVIRVNATDSAFVRRGAPMKIVEIYEVQPVPIRATLRELAHRCGEVTGERSPHEGSHGQSVASSG
jgi:hypothetical protein